MKTLDLKSLLQLILKKWWIIAICVFVCSAAAIVASLYFIDPVYQSNTTIYIVKGELVTADKSDEYMDLLIGSQIIKDYRELAKSRLVANQVLKDLKLDNITVDAFSDKVSVDLKNDTRVIQISATDTSPVMAKIIADKVTDVFIEKVVDIMQAMNAKVIDRAEVPEKPIKPNKVKYTAAAFALGFALGFGIIFLIEFLDNTVKTAEDIKEFMNLPVIGRIPVFSDKLQCGPQFAYSRFIFTYENLKSSVAEAYRILRTNILFSNVNKRLKSFVVTSSRNCEGKTTTVVNLAIAFSQQGNRVLLIDGDLRKPQIHEIFGSGNICGLANFLMEQDDYTKYTKESQIDHLDILVCGAIPPNPSELLLSDAMRKLIQQAGDDYDIVLIDAPPVGMVTDAAITSTMVDGTILVAASGTVSVDDLVRAKELLCNVNANIMGVVLNKLDRKVSGSRYYQYSYYEGGDSRKKDGKKRHKTRAIAGALEKQTGSCI